jgi:hypothetical protein
LRENKRRQPLLQGCYRSPAPYAENPDAGRSIQLQTLLPHIVVYQRWHLPPDAGGADDAAAIAATLRQD